MQKKTLFNFNLFRQIRYPINQRGVQIRYRPTDGTSTSSFNLKGPQRFPTKQKKPKVKKEANNKPSDECDDNDSEKKTILKDDKKDNR